ncbi:MAG: type II secretion system F family protein [archaeon]|nr:type II secretion system F family protein [archaeon]
MPSKKNNHKKETTLDDEEAHLKHLQKEISDLNLLKTSVRHSKKSDLNIMLRQVLASRTFEQFLTAQGKYLFSKRPSLFGKLNSALVSADYNTIAEVYVGKMFFVSSVAFITSFIFFMTYFITNLSEFILSDFILSVLVYPGILAFSVFFIIFYLPFLKVNAKHRSINTNLPFALTHLAAIASSGTPPEEAFRIMSRFREFGSMSVETNNIVKRIDVFGEDITTALRQVISTTPSNSLREILAGILTITQTGGNFGAYLSEMSSIAMFDYKLAKERYVATLSTYADIYTALLLAAPLFLVSILVVMNIIPNTTLPGNLSIMGALSIGVYGLIPGMNVLFLIFITLTTPEM